MNGTPADTTESFRLITDGKPDTVVESDRHADAFDLHIHVSAGYHRNRLDHFNVTWQNNNPDAVRFANAHYQFDSKEILVHRALDGRDFHERLPRPERFIVLPLLQIFTGKAVREAYSLSRGGQVVILIPNIKDPNDHVQLLTLELSLCPVTYLGRDTMIVNDEAFTADVFNFTGGDYDRTAKFWVDENNLLLKYEWQQNDNVWVVRLVEFGG